MRDLRLDSLGALLWAWDADPEFDERAGEQWLILLPKKWNKHVHYGWRYDPRDLSSESEQREQREAAPLRRVRNACPCAEPPIDGLSTCLVLHARSEMQVETVEIC